MPDIATDVSSTFLRLHAARENYAEDQDFHIVKMRCLNFVATSAQKGLRIIMTDPRKAPKTVRRYFKERTFAGVNFSVSRQGKDVATGAQEAFAEHHVDITKYG